jgi:hypothetical protein
MMQHTDNERERDDLLTVSEREMVDRWVAHRLAYLATLPPDQRAPRLTPDEIVHEDDSSLGESDQEDTRGENMFFWASPMLLQLRFFCIKSWSKPVMTMAMKTPAKKSFPKK